jgi:hypothetical protein
MSTSLAIRVIGGPVAPFGLRADLMMIERALMALDHGAGADRGLDADIYEAIGWAVDRAVISRRRIAWRCRSPFSSGWEALPSPTEDVAAAARLVPFRWDWSVGLRGGIPRAWCREQHTPPYREPWFNECQRLTTARSLTAAALFAQRQVVMGALGHA